MKTLSPRAKNVYLALLQYLPLAGTFLIMLHYIIILCGVRTIIVDYLTDTSLFAWVFLYASSQLFFCRLHRAFVIYIGIASLDVDIHHWSSVRYIRPDWLVPVLMIIAALVLFSLVIKLKLSPNEIKP